MKEGEQQGDPVVEGQAEGQERKKVLLFLESENYVQLLCHLYRCILNLSAATLISFRFTQSYTT